MKIYLVKKGQDLCFIERSAEEAESIRWDLVLLKLKESFGNDLSLRFEDEN